jgi:hypothetical protein
MATRTVLGKSGLRDARMPDTIRAVAAPNEKGPQHKAPETISSTASPIIPAEGRRTPLAYPI